MRESRIGELKPNAGWKLDSIEVQRPKRKHISIFVSDIEASTEPINSSFANMALQDNVTSTASILSANVDRRESKFNQLKRAIAELKPVAALVQDMTTKFLNTSLPTGYSILTNHELNQQTHHDTQTQTQIETAIIIADTNISRHTILDTNNRAITAAIITFNGLKLVLISTYIKPRASFAQLTTILDIIKRIVQRHGHSRVVLMGDFNASAPEWEPLVTEQQTHYNQSGSSHYTQLKINRGKQLLRATSLMKLQCINRPELGPTYIDYQQQRNASDDIAKGSYVDLAFLGNKISRQFDCFSLWRPKLTNPTNSHNNIHNNRAKGHQIIILTKQTRLNQQTQPINITYSYPIRKIRDSYFTEIRLTSNRHLFNWTSLNSTQIEDKMNHLAQSLYKCLIYIQHSIRTTRRKTIAQHSLDTINKQNKLARAIRSTQKAAHQTKIKRSKARNTTAIQALHKSRVKLLRRISKLKAKLLLQTRLDQIKRITSTNNQSIRQFFDNQPASSSHNSQSTTSAIGYPHWNIVNQNNNNSNRPTTSELTSAQLWQIINTTKSTIQTDTTNATNTTNPTQLPPIETLADLKFPFKQRTMINAIRHDSQFNEPNDIFHKEVDAAMKEIRNKRYTSPEGIKLSIFAAAFRFIPLFYYTICAMSFHINKVPYKCKFTQGTIIPKKSAGQFRIVHVSSPLAALLERIALHRLESALQERRFLGANQYGFTALRGRHDLVAKMIELILAHRKQAINTRSKSESSTTLIGLDIDSAFDLVDHDILVNKLLSSLDPDPIRFWLANFILDRQIRIKFNNSISKPRQICSGVPQGSSLGPTLWNLMICNIDDQLRLPGTFEILMYADDLLLIFNGKHKALLQERLNKLIQTLANMKLRIRPEKCTTMVLFDGKKEAGQHKYLISGEPIKEATTMSILGVPINNHLKLDRTDNKFNETIKLNTLTLYNINKLNVTNKSQEWNALIGSLIKSILIDNNYPVLAIDPASCKWCDKQITNSIRTIFGWASNTSEKLSNLLTNSCSTKAQVEQLILDRITTEHSSSHTALMKQMKQTKHNQPTQPTPQTIDRITPNSAQPRYAYPPHLIGRLDWVELNTQQQDFTLQLKGRSGRLIGPAWTLIESNKATYSFEILADSILQSISVTHSGYPIAYFNSMAALYYLANKDNITNRKLILNQSNSLIQALCNHANHDWRIVKLRTLLMEQGWIIYLIDKRELTILHELIHYITTDSNYNTTHHNLIQPYLADLNQRNQHNKLNRHNKHTELNSMHTTITRAIGPNIGTWTKISPSSINPASAIALTGLILTYDNNCINVSQHDSTINPNSTLTHGHLEPGEMPHGCNSHDCANNNYGHTTLHRLYHCPRFQNITSNQPNQTNQLNQLRQLISIVTDLSRAK